MEPPHGIDINEHLDLIQMVAASMPRAKWLLSPDVFPQVQSEGWLGLYEALKKFDPAKGNPDKTVIQRFRIYAPNRIKNRISTWLEQAQWYDPLESYDNVAARPLTPGNYKGVTERPLTPGDYMGVAADLHEAKELMEKFWERLDKLPARLREVVLLVLARKSRKEIAAKLGKSEAAISMSLNLAKQKLRTGMRLAQQTPMNPQTIAEVDAQIDMLLPDAGNLALQRQPEETMSIAGFELERCIGTGGHAEVWRAKKHVQKPAKEQLVAIKRLLPQKETSPDAQRRFAREVRTASKLKHPNIVLFDDCVYDNGSLALVMEYVEGRNLAQLIAEGPLSRDAAIYVVEQVLTGLSHAHERGIVHRDIKPANILISRDGAVKVSDFGIAQAAVTHPTAVRPNVTQGTPDWMSPEHAVGSPVDERSDLFVVGRVLRVALRERLDTELGAYVKKLMRLAPEDRFQTAAEALEALPKCDHRRATRELMAHVRGEAMPVDEARPSVASLAPPSTAIVPPLHVVSAAQSATSRRATIAISVLAAIVLLLTWALVAQRWADDDETQSPVVESVSEPVPAVAPVAEPVPAVESVAEPPSVVVIRELREPRAQAPVSEPKRMKKRQVKRPLAQPVERSTERYIWPESDDEAISRVLNRPMPPNPYRNKRGTL